MVCHVDDSVEMYLGSAALLEITFLDSPECGADSYPERWGMISLSGVDFGGSIGVTGAIPEDDEFDAKTKFDDVDDEDDDDDFADDDDDDADDDDDDDDDDADFDDDDDVEEDDEDEEDEEF